MQPVAVDPFTEIGIEWDANNTVRYKFEQDMGYEIRHYQRMGIDADSQAVIIRMEKELGHHLLHNARLTLQMTLKAICLPYDLELQYSDQDNRIYEGMKVGSFSLGFCSVYANDIHQDNNMVIVASPKRSNEITERVARLYAAAYSDTKGKTRIMHLYEFGNRQSLLVKKLNDEMAKYSDTLGGLSTYLKDGLL